MDVSHGDCAADAWEELTDFFNARAQLREDNERLRQENLVLSGQAQQLAAVVAENARYRALLNSAEDINESRSGCASHSCHP
jgi:cell shape-determining protein MreC